MDALPRYVMYMRVYSSSGHGPFETKSRRTRDTAHTTSTDACTTYSTEKAEHRDNTLYRICARRRRPRVSLEATDEFLIKRSQVQAPLSTETHGRSLKRLINPSMSMNSHPKPTTPCSTCQLSTPCLSSRFSKHAGHLYHHP